MSALSSIPPKVIMIHDVRRYYMCNIGEVRDYDIREAFENLCNEAIFKDEFKFVERKGLNHALEFPTNFKIEWIKVAFSRVCDMQLWLGNGPIKITKEIIHSSTSYLTIIWNKIM